MNMHEAEMFISDNINMSNKSIDKVSESNNYFIFNIVTFDVNGNARHSFIPPLCVHKKSGRVAYINPMEFSKDELASIKLVR